MVIGRQKTSVNQRGLGFPPLKGLHSAAPSLTGLSIQLQCPGSMVQQQQRQGTKNSKFAEDNSSAVAVKAALHRPVFLLPPRCFAAACWGESRIMKTE